MEPPTDPEDGAERSRPQIPRVIFSCVYLHHPNLCCGVNITARAQPGGTLVFISNSLADIKYITTEQFKSDFPKRRLGAARGPFGNWMSPRKSEQHQFPDDTSFYCVYIQNL